jgi:hypothetical protein
MRGEAIDDVFSGTNTSKVEAKRLSEHVDFSRSVKIRQQNKTASP